jgi:hypothetical protein
VKGDIELQQIKFRYPTRPNIQIFEDLCLSIPAAKVIKNKFTNLIRLNFIYTISIIFFLYGQLGLLEEKAKLHREKQKPYSS